MKSETVSFINCRGRLINMIEIFAVGGYSEFGRNMTAVKIGDEVVIIDMGIHMENYIKLQGKDDIETIGTRKLLENDAIPKFHLIDEWKDKVKAIIPTHAHLDHIGAIPFIAKKYKADIVCTPFTAEVIKAIADDKRYRIRNDIKQVNPNSSYKISEKISVDLINMTHSTPQTVMVRINSNEGDVLYANDFKFDLSPTLGPKPNFEKLRQIKGVKCLISDCTRSWDAKKTPSESVAKEMLKDVLYGIESQDNLIVATTFSSHIARLKSMIEVGRQKGREIVMLGRSLEKYVDAGEKVGIIDFSDVNRIRYRDKIKRFLKKVKQDPSRYMLIVTGHQGEPEAILSDMAYGKIDYKFNSGDVVIFSCGIIPNEENEKNREFLEDKLNAKKVRIFRDIHVSGHAAREELRDLLMMTQPSNIIPAHGYPDMMENMKKLALEMGYDEKSIHLAKNGDKIIIE